jgi:hypothetical protein
MINLALIRQCQAHCADHRQSPQLLSHVSRGVAIDGQQAGLPRGWDVLPDPVDHGWATGGVGSVVEDRVAEEDEVGHAGHYDHASWIWDR